MAEEVIEDIVVTARSSAELSSSGGGGGWGGGWGGDAFVFNANDTWGGFFSGYSDLVYEVPIPPLPYSVEEMGDGVLVKTYDFYNGEVYLDGFDGNGTSFDGSRPMTDADRAMAPYLNWGLGELEA